MTLWYQLTRLIWWPRSPYVASALFGVLIGALFAGLSAVGMYGVTYSGASPDVIVGLLVGLLFGTFAAATTWRVRRRWAELEVVSDVERLTAIHAVHYGEDVGTERLAAATLEFAAWQRARIERRSRETALNLCGVFGGMAFGGVLVLAQGGHWLEAAAAVPVALLLTFIGINGERRMRRLPDELWRAEWYATWRLEHAETG